MSCAEDEVKLILVCWGETMPARDRKCFFYGVPREYCTEEWPKPSPGYNGIVCGTCGHRYHDITVVDGKEGDSDSDSDDESS